MLRPTGPSSGITSTRPSSDVMQYTVRHLTRFTYDNPISESVMEVRMQPRTEQHQRCLGFELTTTPRATITPYRDPLDNIVHHFDIPGRHGQLTIVAEAIVEFVGTPEPARRRCRSTPGTTSRRSGARTCTGMSCRRSVLARETPLLQGLRRRRCRTATAAIRCRRCWRSTRRSTAASPTASRSPASTRRSTTRSRAARACARTSPT